MIFQDGEFRQFASDEPMLFDGWGYVPVETTVSAGSLSKRGASSNPENAAGNKQGSPDRLHLHQVLL